MLPEDIVQQTLNNNTNLYPSVEEKHLHDSRKHYGYIFPGLSYHRQKETVSSNTLFPTAKSSCGHTFSQLFIGTVSSMFSVYPLEEGGQNVTDLQY